MKKNYNSPETTLVRVELVHMIAESLTMTFYEGAGKSETVLSRRDASIWGDEDEEDFE